MSIIKNTAGDDFDYDEIDGLNNIGATFMAILQAAGAGKQEIWAMYDTVMAQLILLPAQDVWCLHVLIQNQVD